MVRLSYENYKQESPEDPLKIIKRPSGSQGSKHNRNLTLIQG